jgi:hypothetical protein
MLMNTDILNCKNNKNTCHLYQSKGDHSYKFCNIPDVHMNPNLFIQTVQEMKRLPCREW